MGESFRLQLRASGLFMNHPAESASFSKRVMNIVKGRVMQAIADSKRLKSLFTHSSTKLTILDNSD
jgi:hypothetical protein